MGRKNITKEEEDKMLELKKEGKTYKEIAEELDTSEFTVYRHLPDKIREEAYNLFMEGMDITHIARKLHKGSDWIKRELIKIYWEKNGGELNFSKTKE